MRSALDLRPQQLTHPQCLFQRTAGQEAPAPTVRILNAPPGQTGCQNLLQTHTRIGFLVKLLLARRNGFFKQGRHRHATFPVSQLILQPEPAHRFEAYLAH